MSLRGANKCADASHTAWRWSWSPLWSVARSSAASKLRILCACDVSVLVPVRATPVPVKKRKKTGSGGPVFTLRPFSLRTRTPLGVSEGSLARSPMPIIRPAGCAS